MRQYFKFGDILVYIFIVLLIGAGFLGLRLMGSASDLRKVSIRLGDDTIGLYDLPTGDGEEIIRVDAGGDKYNLVIMTNQGVYIKEANCQDKLCVNWGYIKRPGETLVCLPHRLVVSIIGQGEEPAVDDISS